MRYLKPEELRDGLYVTVESTYVSNPVIYILVEEDGKLYYTTPGSNWKMDATLLNTVWIETEETLQLNRDSKLSKLLC